MKIVKALVYFAGVVLILVLGSVKTSSMQSQITQPIDESKLTVLRGNTHPLARAEYDRGPAPANLAMDRMILLVKSTPEQGMELDQLLAEQQDKSSSNYHKWLTPQQFGEQFGASETDIQKVSGWLESHGFSIDSVANGHNVILFSGNAAQVQSAFHAVIHNYEINGKRYFANANDPAIPTALTPVIAGVASLNNFPRKAAHRFAGAFRRDTSGKLKAAALPTPQFSSSTGCTGQSGTCYALSPYDLATIYNILPLWNANITGSGQTIAIVSDSDIDPSDFSNFRSAFGLPAGTLNQIHNGADPGKNPPGCAAPTCDESEADIDTQWSGAAAPGATIDLVISPTQASFGGDLSAEYVIDGNVNPMPSVLGYSYSSCEFYLGTAQNAFYGGTVVKDFSGEWPQAAAEGIAVVVSTGDEGATSCDGVNNAPGSGLPCIAPNQGDPSAGIPPYNDPAVCGLQVNGIGSTPYDVAVGGTDFNDATTASTYWNSTNGSTSTWESVKGYIPETTYNDTCTNLALDTLVSSSASSTDAAGNCTTFAATGVPTSGTFLPSELVVPAGGGGGPSNCTTPSSTATTPSGCAGGYAKPSWQSALTPADGKRDTPDVSLFAGDGTIANFYLYCENDVTGAACSMNAGTTQTGPYPYILGVGGTSVSAEVFVGMVALLNQAAGSSVGLPNQTLYSLAGQSWANCQSSGTLTSACIFNQVTTGTIAMPCSPTPNGAAADCNLPNGDSIGITQINGANGYDAGTGYNLATGLGSVNAYNLVKEWGIGSGGAADFVISASPAAVTIGSAGGTGTTTLTVVPVNGFGGTVSFASSACSGLPSGATCAFSSSSVNASGTTTLTITAGSSAVVAPSARPFDLSRWNTKTTAALICALVIGIILTIKRVRKLRWSTAAACIVFFSLIAFASCGGGGNGGGGCTSNCGGGGSGVIVPASVTITGTSSTGNLTRTTTVLVTAQ